MNADKNKVFNLLNQIPQERITLVTPKIESYPDSCQPKELCATVIFEWKDKQ